MRILGSCHRALVRAAVERLALDVSKRLRIGLDAHAHCAVHREAYQHVGHVEEQRHVVREPVVEVQEHVTSLSLAEWLSRREAAPEEKKRPPSIVERLRRAPVVVERTRGSLVHQWWTRRTSGGPAGVRAVPTAVRRGPDAAVKRRGGR